MAPYLWQRLRCHDCEAQWYWRTCCGFLFFLIAFYWLFGLFRSYVLILKTYVPLVIDVILLLSSVFHVQGHFVSGVAPRAVPDGDTLWNYFFGLSDLPGSCFK